MSKQYGLCAKCLELKNLTKHHILPRRFFRKQKRPPVILLCRRCHDEIELLIPFRRKMCKDFYISLIKEFIRREDNENRLSSNERSCLKF
jgi:5-methylcytosine-specific restriction endonuclease McrA